MFNSTYFSLRSRNKEEQTLKTKFYQSSSRKVLPFSMKTNLQSQFCKKAQNDCLLSRPVEDVVCDILLISHNPVNTQRN